MQDLEFVQGLCNPFYLKCIGLYVEYVINQGQLIIIILMIPLFWII